MSAWSSWVLTNQAAIDTCAEELMAAGYYSDVHRKKDLQGNEVRSIDIHIPGDDLNPKSDVRVGQVVVLMGSMLLVMSAEDYADSPFYEAP